MQTKTCSDRVGTHLNKYPDRYSRLDSDVLMVFEVGALKIVFLCRFGWFVEMNAGQTTSVVQIGAGKSCSRSVLIYISMCCKYI